MRKPFIAGNWKMNKTCKEAVEFAKEIKDCDLSENVEVAICAPFTALWELKKSLEPTNVKLGAQNVHFEPSGAYTGEVSIAMLEEIGVDYCIIGHSERRMYFNETDETVNQKLKALFESTVKPIFCVGESLEEREAGKANEIVKNQVVKGLAGIDAKYIKELVLAYEPVWAIGTGKTATKEQANEIIAYIRGVIAELYTQEDADQVRIQYGGSVKAGNAAEIMGESDIDGALVGGASLAVADFTGIVNY